MTENPFALSTLYISEYTNWGLLGFQTVLNYAHNAKPILWCKNDPIPNLINNWTGDLIVSFKSDLILPKALLNRASTGAINFHPGPPRYRGVGGYDWALHNQDKEYGVTCHFMTDKIDAGPIIDVISFPIVPGETVSSLRFKTAIYLLSQLTTILSSLSLNGQLTTKRMEWGSRLYTYRDLNSLHHEA